MSSMTIDDAVARATASQPYMPQSVLITGSMAQTHAFLSQCYVLGVASGRTGWPAAWPAVAEKFLHLRLTRTHVPVDDVLNRAIITLLGLGLTPADVVNILSGYCYDMVARMTHSATPETSSAMAGAHLEWLETQLTKQVSTTLRVEPQMLYAMTAMSQAQQQPQQAAQPGTGGISRADGTLTRGLYGLGRGITALPAGMSSWYEKTTTKREVSAEGAGMSGTLKSETTRVAAQPPPTSTAEQLGAAVPPK